MLEAVVGWFRAASVVPQVPGGGVVGGGVVGGVVPPAVPNTWNSHSEYPYPPTRAVPYIRT